MGERRSSLFRAKQGDFKLMVGSWNVGNNQMEEDQMKFWVPEGGGGDDMIVVGVQECSYKLKGDKTKDEIDEMLQEYTEDLDDVALKLAGGEEAAKENDAKLALRTPSRKRRSSVDGIMARGVAEGKSAEDQIKQEKIEAAAQVRNDKSHSHFERCIELALGLNYVKVEGLHGGPMKIICYAHKKIQPFITEVESNYECVAGARFGPITDHPHRRRVLLIGAPYSFVLLPHLVLK